MWAFMYLLCWKLRDRSTPNLFTTFFFTDIFALFHPHIDILDKLWFYTLVYIYIKFFASSQNWKVPSNILFCSHFSFCTLKVMNKADSKKFPWPGGFYGNNSKFSTLGKLFILPSVQTLFTRFIISRRTKKWHFNSPTYIMYLINRKHRMFPLLGRFLFGFRFD